MPNFMIPCPIFNNGKRWNTIFEFRENFTGLFIFFISNSLKRTAYLFTLIPVIFNV